MSVIPKEQILRLNCPGYGEESYLTSGKARALDTYSVIVANPVSILHLFDRDLESVKDLDNKLNEGASSYLLKSDTVLQEIESDLKQRIFELVSFLERGGLLVYFLCRPFMVQGPTSAMDNYYWLESLAPDSPAELNVRHMSAISHGRIIETTEQAEKSEFASYFKQPGLEWNTIIRSDFLTEGYIVLATAGPRKCIAAHLLAGDNGGRILFLPAPYSPDFDRTLMDCVGLWQRGKHPGQATGTVPDSAALMAQVAPPPAPYISNSIPPTMFAGLDGAAYYSTAPAEEAQPSSYMPPVPKFSAESKSESFEPAVASSPPPASVHENGDKEHDGGQTGSATSYDDQNATSVNLPNLSFEQMMERKITASHSQAPSRNLLKEMESIAQEQGSRARPEPESEPEVQAEISAAPEPVRPSGQNGDEQTAAVSTSETPAFEAQRSPEPQPESPLRQEEAQPAQDLAVAQEPNAPHFKVEDEDEFAISSLSDQSASSETSDSSGSAGSTEQAYFGGNLSEVSEVQSGGEATPEAKDLIKKMEEMTKTVAPEWAATFSFPDLDDLRKERESLAESIKQTQSRIVAIDNKLVSLDGLKNALLAADGEELKEACSRVFKRIGWNAQQAENEPKELVLLGKQHAEVIARVVRSSTGAPRPDIAQLAQSVLTFWGETEIEPKGLLVASTFVGVAPKNRLEPDFTDSLADFALKKSLCLMTTLQLLCMYRDLELGKMEPEQVRAKILETNGRLAGFELEPARSRV